MQDNTIPRKKELVKVHDSVTNKIQDVFVYMDDNQRVVDYLNELARRGDTFFPATNSASGKTMLFNINNISIILS